MLSHTLLSRVDTLRQQSFVFNLVQVLPALETSHTLDLIASVTLINELESNCDGVRCMQLVNQD